ncbi:hypothetical protein G4B88_030695 [Cannabis sativa]|uniref:Uncharacterized protein n=1 Tax=Cannabis sativa TaxID=3483 RepID=A0A7J6DR53_CANSA|nr:hypothetical protein G4B88_030695 [Cannabis sativa]
MTEIETSRVHFSPPPNHFIYPILKDVMNDPCAAADGYTSDCKATIFIMVKGSLKLILLPATPTTFPSTLRVEDGKSFGVKAYDLGC